jgi:hypothetical protein
MDGWHVSKIYKSLHMTKNQPSLTHVTNVVKNEPSLAHVANMAKNEPS